MALFGSEYKESFSSLFAQCVCNGGALSKVGTYLFATVYLLYYIDKSTYRAKLQYSMLIEKIPAPHMCSLGR